MQAFQKQIRRVLAAFLVLLATTVCQAQSKAEIERGIARAFNSDAPAIAASDFDGMIEFRKLQSQWNQVATPIVRDYLNPNYPRDRWVTEAVPFATELRSIYLQMQASTLSFKDFGVRRHFLRVVGTYKLKLDGITHLHNSVAKDDLSAEQDALAEIASASSEALAIGNALFDKLAPYLSAEELKNLSKQTQQAIKGNTLNR
jgi:hypothetical protein